MSLVGALTKALKAGETAKKTAPFYSAVDEALANIARPKGTGAEFFTELSKQAGVKKAELADRKLEQAFKAKGKITKEEAQQILKENPPPKLKEKVLDESQVLEEDELKDLISQEMFGKPYDEVYNQGQRSRVFDEAMRRMDEGNGPVYGDYRTPGGQNYREILLKLPVFNKTDARRIMELEANLRRGELPTNEMQELVALQAKKESFGTPYYSNHWKEDPNVLAHMRVQDRTGPNGEKILHVEEIQSDWHQAGRKKGYAQPETSRMTGNVVDAGDGTYRVEWPDGTFSGGYNWASAMEKAEQGKSNAKPGVPDAPFKKNWHELAMKRLLNYAADKGYDSIAITPGAEQAKRYSLAKQLDEVQFDPSTGYLAGRDHNGRLVVAQKGVTVENLEDYIGKEGAQKILQSPVDEVGQHSLRGADLEVGGEGMKGFYDQILPSYLNTFGKPYGAQVGKLPIAHGDKAPSYGLPSMAEFQQNRLPEETMMQYIERMKGEPNIMEAHNFPITPEMRQQIQQKGLPLYQQIGIPTAGAGAASQMPEMDFEPEVKKADGGAINYNTAPDMSDGGRIMQGAPFKHGGKVKVTTNRDAMFMELSNKKLKRK